uniref:C-type lectin domain-containing protein n=1 Tax=Caenorhabditis tropicalis TaxID=1561998 RepID=A0A1I7UUQ8_9PELO
MIHFHYIFGPPLLQEGNDDCECDCDSSEGTSPTPSEDTTTMKWSYTCPIGWHSFTRTPSEFNQNTGVWCVKFIPSDTVITINNGSSLCEKEDAVLTAFENSEERDTVIAEVQSHIIGKLERTVGAIALSGKRIKECSTSNIWIIGSPPCNDKTKVFSLPLSSGTNPEFLWTNWAPNEPSANHWTYDVEDCNQMFISPNDPERDGKINDFYCVLSHAPNDPENEMYWNYGALCGQAPAIESVL